MNTGYLNIPCEMAQLALTSRNCSRVASYLAAHFIYSGKARTSDNSANEVALLTDNTPRTVHRHFRWLIDRNWIGKDSDNGWYFFRGIGFVHELEGWQYSKAALMLKEDLRHAKEFFIGAVLASLNKTRQGAETERVSRRSEQFGFPCSLSLIQKVLGCSRKTAFTYRKIAKKRGFIKMIPNLQQVELSTKDIHMIKHNSEKVTVTLFGTRNSIEVKPEQLRSDKGYVYAQLPNLITPNIQLKKRR